MSDALRTFSLIGRSALGRFRPRRRGDRTAGGGLQGRLFRKYVLLLVGLVALVLLVNAGLHFWFSYNQEETAAYRFQQEKAKSAARRIEGFIDEIEHQLGWTTAPQWAAAPIEQRQFDYVRLLRQVPAITELIQLDSSGKEQLRVSRLTMDVIASGKDYSQEPSFTEAKKQRVWFSPVYFRKESEPYLTLAMAQAGSNAGVTIAEVNLKLIWDVISGMKVGQGGYAFVIDRNGRLIAHPDISLVLRDSDLAGLTQVAAAHAEAQTDQAAPPAMVAKNLGGETVLTAHAGIVPLGWTVFVELPLREAMAPLYQSTLRNAALLAVAIGLAALAALFLARRMTVPIRLLQAGAARIGAGELDRRIDIHTGDELEELAGEFNRMAGDLQKSYAELEQKVEDRTAELKEALTQQTATAEVLGVINSSPGDLAPVFDAMLEKATRLCEASFGTLSQIDGDQFCGMAWHNAPAAFVETMRHPRTIVPGNAHYRLLQGEDVVHIEDVTAEDVYRSGNPARRALADLAGARTVLWAALRKDNKLLGAFVIYRQEVRLFSDKQIALLQNFAAQAVIAMENARLLTETREALEQQTATAEVLQVINSSPGDLTPVFDAILEKAHTLCGAAHGSLQLYDGENLHAVATRAVSDKFAEVLRQGYRAADSPASRALMRGERSIQIADCTGIDHPVFRSSAELSGIRTVLFVPLRKDDAFLGLISAARQEVRPFSDKQIALLQNFAAQAVIAMENARLITETREALEQQTATAEVLQVINSSPGDLMPVFDAMLAKALHLCGAAFGALFTYDGGECFPCVATRGLPPALLEYYRPPVRNLPGSAMERLIHGQSTSQVTDLRTDQLRSPLRRALADLGGARTMIWVALRKEKSLLGCIAIYRQEVRPFSEKEIALLENFAAQAVIAMENARLLTETRDRSRDLQESLEYQTATSEVLKVISQSGTDLEPVLQMLVETAGRLCDADQGYVFRLREGRHHLVASCGVAPEFRDFLMLNPFGIDRGTLSGRTLLERRVVHLEDAASDPEYTWSEAQQRGNLHTGLGVPLLREGNLLGVVVLYRSRVELFTEKQIALVTTFADQAVIAIENARLLNDLQGRTRDLQESLEYQTATSDVLKVISQSGAELDSVLQTLTETAARICESDTTAIIRLRDSQLWLAASLGFSAEWRELFERRPFEPDRASATGRAVQERRVIHIEDVTTDPEYGWPDSQQLGKYRTTLAVPLLRDDAAIGVITLGRVRVEAFTDKQIALVTTFADQAVIAIENARLFNELRARTAELGRSVEELKMLSDVGRAVSSTLDLRAVLSTILTASLGITQANAGAVFRYSRAERAFRLVEAAGWDEALLRSVRDLRVAETESAMGEAAARRMPIQLTDLAQRASYPLRDVTLAAGFRSALAVPLVGAERILGAIVLYRHEAGEFPLETVRLMQTLASQSALAIQNARMFREIADKSEQLALASQHKSQFLANMSHELRTPLNAILGYAELLVDGIYGVLPERPKGVLERIQNNGKHLLALINDVLDLAKIEAGQLTLTLEDYSLPEVVKSVVTATEPLATSKGLKFTAAVEEHMPTAHGDARRVSQVLLNLVGNAIKFTEAGEVEIRAAAEKGQFVLRVRDTGPGIADADQDRIFGEFQQIDNTNTRKQGGTGLGLAISKRMVEMQGGTISVDSVLGQGSTFRVVLPVHVDEVLEEAA